MASISEENYNPEEYLLDTLNDLDIGFVKVSNNGIILTHNLTFNKIFGYDPEKNLNGTKILDYWLNSEEWNKLREILFKNGIVKKLVVPAKKVDGKKIFLELNFKLNKNSKGEIISSEGTIVDITERKKLEEVLYHERDLIRTLLENHPDFIYFKDKKARFQHISKRFSEFFGRSMEDIIGKSDLELFPEEIAKQTHNEDLQIIKTGIALINKEESTAGTWVLTTKIPWFDKDGNIKGLFGISRDITERKKAELNLKESETKLKKFMESATDGFSLLDSKLNFIDVNKVALQIVGMTKEELIGKNVLDTAPNLKETGRYDKYLDVLKTGESFFTEDVTFNRLDGSLNSYFSLRAFKVGDDLGMIFTDITERMKAEQKLKESEEIYHRLSDQYKMLLESITDGVFLLDKNWVYVLINKTATEMIQMSVDQVIGNKLTVLFPGFEHTQFFKIYNDVMNKRKTKRVMGEFIHPDGRKGYYEVSVYPVTEGILCITRDITEEKVAEQKLKESEERYRNFAQNIQGIAYQGYQDFSAAFIDGAVEEITGYTSEDFTTGRIRLDKIIYPDDAPKIQKKVEIFHSTSAEKDSREYRIVRKNGEIIWILEKCQKIYDSKKKMEGVQGIIVDITQSKKAENELKELSKLKSEFLRRASHELKTPLISIKGFSELILSLYKDQLDTPIISKLREINDGCERLQNIINNLLKTSRLESPDLKPKVQKEDLSFLIKFCVHELESLAERRKQSIKLDIRYELYANIEKEEIHDVLSNLITNAIKYTPPMGKIEIKTELKEDSVVVSINDNGIGFTEEQKTKIFQQFGKIERYGQGLDLGIGGTGLGLYISKRIVEAHGGKIWMESDGKNKGSTFYFTLPTVK